MSKKILSIIGGIFAFLVVILILIPASKPSVSPDTKSEIQEQTITSQANQNSTTNSTAIVQDKNAEVPSTIQTPKQTQTARPQTTNTSTKCKITNYLPDPNCTPGTIDPRVTQDNIQSTICVSGYSASVRPSTSVTNKIKVQQMIAYGDTDSPSNYELDHIISLELGGALADPRNLFPEPYANPMGAREKDKVENYLHKEVCNGSITLKTAQEEIATDWVKIYQQAGFSQSSSAQTNDDDNSATVSNSTTTTTPTATTTGVVKMSTTGICHAPGTTYYNRTTNFTPYNSIADCLAAGGRLPAK